MTTDRSAPLRLRARVWWRAIELDRALAAGRRPAGSPQLELRVQQLASVRVRWALASRMRMLVAGAGNPEATAAWADVGAARAITRARHPLLAIAEALTDPGCTSVRGVAHASCLLCDGLRSPLYDAGRPAALQRVAYDVLAALRSGA